MLSPHSTIDQYLQDLSLAIGDRIPPSVKMARLREAEGHLRMAAAELNQLEAIRRYGSPRAVANAMVRVDRGYDKTSSWRLALPVIGGMLVWHYIQRSFFLLLPALGDEKRAFMGLAVSLFSAFFFVLFIARVVQTRRWLFWPVQICEVAFVLCGALANQWLGHPSFLGFDYLFLSALNLFVHFLINAIALGGANLYDRRRGLRE